MNVLLIGLGKIAYKYDLSLDQPNEYFSVTHLSAARKAGFQTIGGIDTNVDARILFQKHTGIPAWANISQIPKSTRIDVVVICTPPESHLGAILEVFHSFSPKVIICEKPFAGNGHHSRQIIEKCKSQMAALFVNYTRQFSQGFTNFQQFINAEDFRKGCFYYNYGLQNSGSHYLRMILELLGVPESVERALTKGEALNPQFTLRYSQGREFYFIPSPIINTRVADAFIETQNFLGHIYNGNYFRVTQAKGEDEKIRWEYEQKLISEGNFFGGLDNLYSTILSKRNTDDASIDRACSYDQLCNEILDNLKFN